MKTILVLTDLSKKAENAALYALKMAEQMRANIVLYHSFVVFKSVVVPESGMWQLDDYTVVKNDSMIELKKLARVLEERNDKSAFTPKIDVMNDMGNLGANVNQLVHNECIDLVIMGSKSDDLISHLFFGSETGNVLDEVQCPILFVPDKYGYKPLKTIVFSTDLKKAYPKAVNFIINLARVDDAEIVVTHVGEGGTFNAEQCLNLVQQVFEYPNASFRQLAGPHVGDTLKEFVGSVKADLTVMIHHQHVLFGNVIPGSNSKKMLNYHQVPLLILPDLN